MRKGLCLVLFLLSMMLPALAEEAASVPDSYVGEWKYVLTVNGNQIFTPQEESPCLFITEDAFLTVGPQEYSFRLLLDRDAHLPYIQNPDGPEKIYVSLQSGLLKLTDESSSAFMYFTRPDAAPPELAPLKPAASYGGVWRATWLYLWSNTDSDSFPARINFDAFCQEPLFLTLPPACSLETIQQTWMAAISQQPSQSAVQAFTQIYGCDLRTPDDLLLITPYGAVLLYRTEVDPVQQPSVRRYARNVADWWRLADVTVGGIPLPAASVGFAADSITIDHLGYASLDGEVVPLQIIEDTPCIGDYAIDYDDEYLYLSLADGIQARYITEDKWYRLQLVGTWQLSSIKAPTVGLQQNITPADVDVQLVIQPNGRVILRIAGDETAFNLAGTPDVTEYHLISDDGSIQLLTISSLDLLCISNQGGTYSLFFEPAE